MKPSWRVATLYTCALGPFFFLMYGSVNAYTSTRQNVGTFYWEWERSIPFIAWMIVPYWTLDAFYAGSTFVCRSREELNHLAKRMVFAIVVACACFLLFPLRYAFERPAVGGVYGMLFNALSLDKPFNLVPSLHIALRSIVWVPYGRVLTGMPRRLLWLWFALIGISTLFTYQHHVIDLIAGDVLTVVTFYLLPESGSPLPWRRWIPIRPRLAWIYGVPAVLLAAGAAILGGWFLLLLWPALSLSLVSCAYAGAGAAVFQKRDGTLSWPATILLAPYLLGARAWLRLGINARDPYAEAAPSLWIGRRLHGSEARSARLRGVVAVLDLTAEHFEARPFRKLAYKNVQLLDLTVPDMAQLHEAVAFLTQQIPRGAVYVHCALGISRSCGVAAAYLLAARIENSVDGAIARVQAARPRITVGPEWRALLAEFHSAGRHVKAALR